jgi:hypothetical protein
VPWFVTVFFRLISPFIDPVTKMKLKFNEPLTNYVLPEQLYKPHGGAVDFEYDHEVYWPALAKLCEEKRQAQRQRWEEAGKKIGESEAYLKGADPKSEGEKKDGDGS